MDLIKVDYASLIFKLIFIFAYIQAGLCVEQKLTAKQTQGILFSQPSIGSETRDKIPLVKLADNMKKDGFRKDGAILAVNLGKGKLTTFDNRRLAAAQTANTGAWVKVVSPSKTLSKADKERFTIPGRPSPKTYGDAANLRMTKGLSKEKMSKVSQKGGFEKSELKIRRSESLDEDAKKPLREAGFRRFSTGDTKQDTTSTISKKSGEPKTKSSNGNTRCKRSPSITSCFEPKNLNTKSKVGLKPSVRDQFPRSNNPKTSSDPGANSRVVAQKTSDRKASPKSTSPTLSAGKTSPASNSKIIQTNSKPLKTVNSPITKNKPPAPRSKPLKTVKSPITKNKSPAPRSKPIKTVKSPIAKTKPPVTRSKPLKTVKSPITKNKPPVPRSRPIKTVKSPIAKNKPPASRSKPLKTVKSPITENKPSAPNTRSLKPSKIPHSRTPSSTLKKSKASYTPNSVSAATSTRPNKNPIRATAVKAPPKPNTRSSVSKRG